MFANLKLELLSRKIIEWKKSFILFFLLRFCLLMHTAHILSIHSYRLFIFYLSFIFISIVIFVLKIMTNWNTYCQHFVINWWNSVIQNDRILIKGINIFKICSHDFNLLGVFYKQIATLVT